MAERSTPRWVGLHVIWWGGDNWQFTNCVSCHESLRSERAVKNGYGPSCAKEPGIESLVKRTLLQERRRARAAIAEKAPIAPHNRRTRRGTKTRKADSLPSAKQLKYLRSLAEKCGLRFVTPHTSKCASIEIEHLLAKLPKK